MGPYRNEVVRENIVVGVKDWQVSEKLQITANLTLELAMMTGKQNEAVKTSMIYAKVPMPHTQISALSRSF